MSSERSSSASAQLAHEVRERFVTAIERAIGPVAQAIREWLTAQAGQAGSARDLQNHRDALVAFRAQESHWVGLTRSEWRRNLNTVESDGGAHVSLSQLTLLGDEVVENNILSSRLALLIQDKANFELNDLRLRIQYLEGRDDLPSKDVLRAEVLAKILVEQWLAAGLTRAMWSNVQEVVQSRLLKDIVAAYKDANEFLISKGVLPEIKLKDFVKRAHGAPSSMPGGLTAGAAGAAMAQVHGQVLAQQGYVPGGFAPAAIGIGGLTGVAGAAPHNANAGPGPGDGAVPVLVTPLMMARQRAQAVLGSLKRFVVGRIGGNFPQTVPEGAPEGAEGAAAMSPGFAAAIAEAEMGYQVAASQYVAAAGGGNEAAVIQQTALDLRKRSAELKRKAPTTADKATVEIVALMFQAILAEERIPFSARVWFARLQMPVLRVAIAEPEFFATAQHPARMLIDRMGSCVMGFDAAAISGSALEGEIRRVVQVIEQYPETGQRVFKLVYDEFVAFLSKYLTQSHATQRVMSVAQQVEQKETMAIQYTIELRKMLNDVPVRQEIGEFLFKVWAEVLSVASLRYGAQDQRTVMLKGVASELVWAASAKPNRADRTRVIQNLPSLLQRLRQGMEILSITGEPQDEHIRTIGETLTDAFMSKTEAIPAAKIEALAQRLANLEEFVGDEGGDLSMQIDAASIELLLGVDAASIEVVPDTGGRVGEDMLTWAHELQVGAWFMLDHNGRASQVQFVWRSERKQLHLFAAADGRSFLIQAGRLASYLQAGLLVPAEEETLTARATREALAKLDANPERLLN